MFAGLPDVRGAVLSAKLRALAVPSAVRSPILPQGPTMIEEGYPNFDVATWFGVAGPGSLPPILVSRYYNAIRTVLARPDIIARLADAGIEVRTDTAQEFEAYIKAETKKWAPLVKASGATTE
jgi:tripartite-type tricarboxylate transporter receptor subunit TctC